MTVAERNGACHRPLRFGFVHSGMCVLAVLLALITCAAAAQDGGEDAEDLLAESRWTEQKYGLSLRLPVGARTVSHTADEYLLRLVHEQQDYQMTVAVRRSREALTLERVAESAQLQVVDAEPTARLIEQEQTSVGERPARVLLFRVPADQARDALLGQAILRIDPFTFAVLEIRGSLADQPHLRRVLNAMLGTLRIADQEQLAAERKAAVERSTAWRERLTVDQIEAAVGGEAYFRLLQNGEDIGYLRVVSRMETFNNQRGPEVSVATHLEMDGRRVDSVAEYFRPADSAVGEAWSIRTTIRAPGMEDRTIVETGAGTTGFIEVKQDGTAGVASKNLRFARPPNGYLPQADGWLLPRLIPRETAGVYGFYWYHNNEQAVTFRRDRVTPTLDGFVIVTQLTPNSPELTARYDAEGNLREKQLGGGRVLKRTDLRQLRTLWNLRQ